MTGGLGLNQYAAFLGDRLNLDVLSDTLLLGVKATLLCLVFRLSAGLAMHAGDRRGCRRC